jgi:hypothetical protein
MAESPDRRGTAEGDGTESSPSEAAENEDARQQQDTRGVVPEARRRPRLYGYDPDQWPDQA